MSFKGAGSRGGVDVLYRSTAYCWCCAMPDCIYCSRGRLKNNRATPLSSISHDAIQKSYDTTPCRCLANKVAAGDESVKVDICSRSERISSESAMLCGGARFSSPAGLGVRLLVRHVPQGCGGYVRELHQGGPILGGLSYYFAQSKLLASTAGKESEW